jgi:RNA recognition motif-containing protein
MNKEKKPLKTIYIGNLNSLITEEELLEIFKEFGRIINVKFAGNSDYPTRFAFIEYNEEKEAEDACKLNGTQLQSKK